MEVRISVAMAETCGSESVKPNRNSFKKSSLNGSMVSNSSCLSLESGVGGTTSNNMLLCVLDADVLWTSERIILSPDNLNEGLKQD